MRFLKVSLAALLILVMLHGTAMAEEAAPNNPETSDPAPADPAPEQPAPSDPAPEAPADPAAPEPDPASDPDAVYAVKLEAYVVAVTPPTGDQPGSLTLMVAGKEFTVPYTAEMLKGEVAEGSYVELKGSTEAVEKIEVSLEGEEGRSTLKTTVVAVSWSGSNAEGAEGAEGKEGAEGAVGSATLTLMVAGQEMTFTAEELGLTEEAMALIATGAEFKLETSADGTMSLRVTSEAGTVKVQMNEAGEAKVKLDAGKPGKGEEMSAAAKAAAEARKEAAKKWAEEAKRKAEAAKRKAEEEARKKAEAERERAREETNKRKDEAKSGGKGRR